MKSLARRRTPTSGAVPGIDPALVPFLDVLAEMLAEEDKRLAESRRVLREAAEKLRSTPTRK
ncbi:MAG: hypothetical protein HY661_03755 [Betaproteobacteria bacterium]|nr:hypothetical protein [Betaproteobacteria bacterium]